MATRLDEIISRIEKKLDRIEEKVEEVQKSQNEYNLKISRHQHDLYGNGKKGLCQKVEDLENVQGQHSKYFWGATTSGAFIGWLINTWISYKK